MKWAMLLPLVLWSANSAVAAEKIIGLLSLPEVFGDSGPCDETLTPRPVLLYLAPGSSQVLGELRVDWAPTGSEDPRCAVNVHLRTGEVSEFPTDEYGYEEQGAMVLDQRDRWFRIRLSDGAAWVHASAQDHFYSIQELLGKSGLVYVTEAWDKRIARSPGGELRPLENDPRRRMIAYLTPVSTDVTAVLAHGQDPEAIRKRYRSTGMGSVQNKDGTVTVFIHTSTQVDAFESPEARAPVAFSFWNDEVSLLRGVYGSSAFVFDRRPGWFQVARRNEENRPDWKTEQRLWVRESPAWEFHSVDDAGERQQLAEDGWGPAYHDVRVLGFQRVGDELWAEVELLDQSYCEGNEDPKAVGRGWIPVYDRTGERTIWFPSRGC